MNNIINVWDNSSPDTSSGGARLNSHEEKTVKTTATESRRGTIPNSARKATPATETSWKVARERVFDMGNGRKIHETKLVNRNMMKPEKHEAVKKDAPGVSSKSPEPSQKPAANVWAASSPSDLGIVKQKQELASSISDVVAQVLADELAREPSSLQMMGSREDTSEKNQGKYPQQSQLDFVPGRIQYFTQWIKAVQCQYASGHHDGDHDAADCATNKGQDTDVGGAGSGCVFSSDCATQAVSSDYGCWPTLVDRPENNNHNLPPTEPTGELHQLRMRILSNFGERCRYAHGMSHDEKNENDKGIENKKGRAADEEEDNHKDQENNGICRLCASADDFTMRPQHGRLFLDSVLRPLSEMVCYADMVVHVNTSVLERLHAEIDTKQLCPGSYDKRTLDGLKAMPIYEDYKRALVLAVHRRRVMEVLPMRLDGCGMTCIEKK